MDFDVCTMHLVYFIVQTNQYATYTYKQYIIYRKCSYHCVTSPKVAGSIPDGVIGIFHWHIPSGRTMKLESTQPLTEMSTGKIPAG